MKTNIDELASQAMDLSSDLRAQLAEKLIESLENETIEKIWLSEAKKRRDEVRSGKVEAIDGEEALNKVRSLIGNK